jgi:hypothetical protein
MPETVIAATARAGSLLALALGLWYGCAAAGLPFAAFLVLFLAVAAGLIAWSRRIRRDQAAPDAGTDHSRLPLIPLIIVTATILSPVALTLRGTHGDAPYWFTSSDEAFTTLAARGLEIRFPPPDLSWAGQPLRYHLGAALMIDLLHRATGLPLQAVQYGLAPIVIRLILIGALLLLARRIAPELPGRWRVWMPLAAGAIPTIDVLAIAWHVHDLGVRGRDALSDLAAVPMVDFSHGLLGAPVFESSFLAMAFAIILIATWRETTWIEKAALLFAVFLAKSQVFLAVGAGYGVVALMELLRRRWQAAAAGALALACVVPTLGNASTYGRLAHMSLGCGALCRSLLSRHHLDGHLPGAALLALEMLGFIAGFHLIALAVVHAVWRLRRSASLELTLSVAIAAAGLAVPAMLTLVPSPELERRFLAVHAGVASQLFMPLPTYLSGIFDVSVRAALDAFVLLLPILAPPLLGAWMLRTTRRAVRAFLAVAIASLLALGAFGTSFLSSSHILFRAKEVDPAARNVLRAIPADAHAVITNDLAWDDVQERHLPLLNIWAPAVSGRQFWASAFMFTFQHPDAPERLQRIAWFFSPSTAPRDRLAFAQKAGIDYVFLRKTETWRADGWTLVAGQGDYALYRRTGTSRTTDNRQLTTDDEPVVRKAS